MKDKGERCSEEQIIYVPRQVDGGRKVFARKNNPAF